MTSWRFNKNQIMSGKISISNNTKYTFWLGVDTLHENKDILVKHFLL
jgi:hypothetical protein